MKHLFIYPFVDHGYSYSSIVLFFVELIRDLLSDMKNDKTFYLRTFNHQASNGI